MVRQNMRQNLRKNSPSLDSPTAKILAMIDTVARKRAAPLSTLAEELNIPTPTAHRICRELERLGWLQRAPGSRQWTAATALVELAANTLTSAANGAAAHAVLRSLTAEIGEMSSFAVHVADQVVYIANAEPTQELTLSFRAGRKAPLFCTSSGRLFLARLDDAALRQYFRAADCQAYTRHTITDRKKLLAIVKHVRAVGYAITEQEYILHVVGAGVPVVGRDGMFFGVLSIAAPDVRCTSARLVGLIPVLVRAASRLAGQLAALQGGGQER